VVGDVFISSWGGVGFFKFIESDSKWVCRLGPSYLFVVFFWFPPFPIIREVGILCELGKSYQCSCENVWVLYENMYPFVVGFINVLTVVDGFSEGRKFWRCVLAFGVYFKGFTTLLHHSDLLPISEHLRESGPSHGVPISEHLRESGPSPVSFFLYFDWELGCPHGL